MILAYDENKRSLLDHFFICFHTVTIATGACASRSTCERTCEALVQSTLIKGFADAAFVDPSIVDFELL